MTDLFFICSIKSPQCTDKYSGKVFSLAIFLSVLWCTKSIKFHFRWGTKPRDQKQGTGNDSDVNSGLQASRKTDFSDVFLFSHKQRTIVPFISKLITTQFCFSRGLESWIDVIIVPSLLFWVSRFCTPLEVKFDAFGTSKHGERKSLWKKIFATLISTLGRFNRANKKNSVIYTVITGITLDIRPIWGIYCLTLRISCGHFFDSGCLFTFRDRKYQFSIPENEHLSIRAFLWSTDSHSHISHHHHRFLGGEMK